MTDKTVSTEGLVIAAPAARVSASRRTYAAPLARVLALSKTQNVFRGEIFGIKRRVRGFRVCGPAGLHGERNERQDGEH